MPEHIKPLCKRTPSSHRTGRFGFDRPGKMHLTRLKSECVASRMICDFRVGINQGSKFRLTHRKMSWITIITRQRLISGFFLPNYNCNYISGNTCKTAGHRGAFVSGVRNHRWPQIRRYAASLTRINAFRICNFFFFRWTKFLNYPNYKFYKTNYIIIFTKVLLPFLFNLFFLTILILYYTVKKILEICAREIYFTSNIYTFFIRVFAIL